MLFILQTYPGDAQEALALARLIREISHPNPDIRFMLAADNRTERAICWEILKELAHVAPTINQPFWSSEVDGYPEGPNTLWRELMTFIADHKGPLDGFDFTGCLTFEPDCIPCRRDWIATILNEWDTTERAGRKAMGHVAKSKTFINGNMVLRRDVLKDHLHLRQPIRSNPWDVRHGGFFLKIGRDTFAIYQEGKVFDFDLDQYRRVRKDGRVPALWHGIKDPSRFETVSHYAPWK